MSPQYTFGWLTKRPMADREVEVDLSISPKGVNYQSSSLGVLPIDLRHGASENEHSDSKQPIRPSHNRS